MLAPGCSSIAILPAFLRDSAFRSLFQGPAT
jgi:hypothetical protein